MIELLGVFLLVLGILALVRGLRGRLLNTHPHCRGCGFDLHGLHIESEANCPECGRSVRSGGPSIRIGKRQRRPALISLGVLVMLLGIAGVGWQPLSRISGLQNIDWYDYLPERMLLSLEAKGNTNALAELHSRLIPDELSDEGLQKLVDRSLAMLDDESVPWDERWGDVLLYAFLTDRMSEEDAKSYLEHALAVRVEIADQIGPNVTTLQYTLTKYTPERGKSSGAFRGQIGTVVGVSGFSRQPVSPYDFSGKSRIPHFAASGRGRPDRFGSWLTWPNENSGGWLPFRGGSIGSGSDIRLAPNKETYQLPFAARFEVKKDGIPFHQWEIEINKVIKRVDHPLYYDQLTDVAQLERIAESLRIPGIRVPDDPHAAQELDSVAESSERITTINSSIKAPVGLLGDLWVENGVDRVRLDSVSISPLKESIYSISTRNTTPGRQSGGVNYFIENNAFWEQARARGAVDIIYEPDPNRKVMGGTVDNTIARGIIWRDVPVVITTLQPERYQNTDGSITVRTKLSEPPGQRPLVSGMPHPDAIPGELLDTPETDE